MKSANGKKAKAGKTKQTVQSGKTAKKSPRASSPADLGAVRQRISKIVSGAAENIAKKLVNKAQDGELAHSKYLFEMTGVYPMGDAAGKPPEEESLAKTLLQRMGLPTTPVIEDEDGETRELAVTETSKDSPAKESEDVPAEHAIKHSEGEDGEA